MNVEENEIKEESKDKEMEQETKINVFIVYVRQKSILWKNWKLNDEKIKLFEQSKVTE